MDGDHPFGARLHQSLSHQFGPFSIEDADDLALDRSGIAHRTEHVEYRTDTQFLTDRPHVLKSRVEVGGKEKGHAGFGQTFFKDGNGWVNLDAQGFQHLRTTALAG